MQYKKKEQAWLIPQLTALVMCLLCAGSGYAQNTQGTKQLELRVGYGYSDNAPRDDVIEVDSQFTIVGLTVDWDVLRPRYELNLQGNVDYISYSDDQIRDRPQGDLNARLAVQLIPSRLSWFVEDTYSQIRQDVTQGNTPDNLSEINVLSSGIVANLPISNRTILQIDAAASDRQVDFLNTLDSKENTAGIALIRQFRPRSRLGIVANLSNIVYDDVLNTEYDIESVVIRYESQLARGDITVDVGVNRLDDKSQPSSGSSEPLFNVDWSRSIGSRSQLQISARHQISELGGSIVGGGVPQVGVGQTGRVVATPNSFRDTTLSVLLNSRWDRTRLTSNIVLSQQVFDSNTGDDASGVGINLSMLRDLSNTVSVQLSGIFGRRQLTRSGGESDDISAGITIRKVFRRRIAVSGSYSFNRRETQIGQDFTENMVRVDLAVLVRR